MDVNAVFFHNFERICRICLCEADGMVNMFDPLVGIANILTILSGVQVFTGDGLPSHICPTCLGQAGIVREFKRKCETSNVTLKSYLKKVVPDDIKEECPLDIHDLENTFAPVTDYITQSFDFYDSNTALSNRFETNNVCDQSLTEDFFFDKQSPPHSCNTCNRKYQSAFDLLKHQGTHKNLKCNGKNGSCTGCNGEFPNHDLSQQHPPNHTSGYQEKLHRNYDNAKTNYDKENRKMDSKENASSDKVEILSDFDFLDVSGIKMESDLALNDKIGDETCSNFNITNFSDDSKLNFLIGNLMDENLDCLSVVDLDQTIDRIVSPTLEVSETDAKKRNQKNIKKKAPKDSLHKCHMCFVEFKHYLLYRNHMKFSHNHETSPKKGQGAFDSLKHQATPRSYKFNEKSNSYTNCSNEFTNNDLLEGHQSSGYQEKLHTDDDNANTNFAKHDNPEMNGKVKTGSNKGENLSDFDFLNVSDIKIESDLAFDDKIGDEACSNFNMTNFSDDVFIVDLINEKLDCLNVEELGQTIDRIASPTLEVPDARNKKKYKRTIVKVKPQKLTLHKCHLCSVEFRKYLSYRNHMDYSHDLETSPKPFVCADCGKGYIARDRLINHIEMHLEGSHKCDRCPKEYWRTTDLVAHMKTHTNTENASVLCIHCGKMYNNKRTLKNHVLKHHSNNGAAQRHVCPICRREFKFPNNLHLHMKIHQDRSVMQAEADSKNSNKKSVLCATCGKSCTSSSNLAVHVRRHTGKMTSICRICGKGYPRTTDLTLHMRSHTGERPFVCTVCSKNFIRSDKLARHMRTHTGERPYICQCGQTFTQSNDLTLHRKKRCCKYDSSVSDHGESKKNKVEVENAMAQDVGRVEPELEFRKPIVLEFDEPRKTYKCKDGSSNESTLVSGKVTLGATHMLKRSLLKPDAIAAKKGLTPASVCCDNTMAFERMHLSDIASASLLQNISFQNAHQLKIVNQSKHNTLSI